MRVEKRIAIDAPREEVWESVSDPRRWRSLMGAGLTQMEHRGGPDTGLGARYEMRMQVGSAAIGGLIEFVEWDEPGELAWTSVTGIDQRGRWRLRRGGGRPDDRDSAVCPTRRRAASGEPSPSGSALRSCRATWTGQ